jgi:hypothetical protein
MNIIYKDIRKKLFIYNKIKKNFLFVYNKLTKK